MKLTALTDFKHETKAYTEGKKYDVPDMLAGYFLGNGWAEGPGGERNLDPPSTDGVELDVQNPVHNSTSEVTNG